MSPPQAVRVELELSDARKSQNQTNVTELSLYNGGPAGSLPFSAVSNRNGHVTFDVYDSSFENVAARLEQNPLGRVRNFTVSRQLARNGQCADGYIGLLCGECDFEQGFVRAAVGGLCRRCTDGEREGKG